MVFWNGPYSDRCFVQRVDFGVVSGFVLCPRFTGVDLVCPGLGHQINLGLVFVAFDAKLPLCLCVQNAVNI